MSASGDERAPATPTRVPKASDALADDLRERILSEQIPAGTALPPERELVVQTQMSRTTVREALRILEVQGLVRIKTGRSGGAFVQRPGGESVASSVALLIRGGSVQLASVLETREAIEPSCAELAAARRTDDDLAALDRANVDIADATGSLTDFLQANIDWHVAVATASHNELLTGFMLALSRALYTVTDNQQFIDADVRRTAVQAHRRITEAIRAGDAVAAGRRMSRHVHGHARALLAVDERTDIPVPES